VYSGRTIFVMCPTLDVHCHSQILSPWPHGIVKCSSSAHFRILLEVVGHPGTFCFLFDEYCEFRHTLLFLLYREVYTISEAALESGQIGSSLKIKGTFKFKTFCYGFQVEHDVQPGVWDTFSLVRWVCQTCSPISSNMYIKYAVLKWTRTMASKKVFYQCVRCSSV